MYCDSKPMNNTKRTERCQRNWNSRIKTEIHLYLYENNSPNCQVTKLFDKWDDKYTNQIH